MEDLTLQELITLDYVLWDAYEDANSPEAKRLISSIIKKAAAEFAKR